MRNPFKYKDKKVKIGGKFTYDNRSLKPKKELEKQISGIKDSTEKLIAETDLTTREHAQKEYLHRRALDAEIIDKKVSRGDKKALLKYTDTDPRKKLKGVSGYFKNPKHFHKEGYSQKPTVVVSDDKASTALHELDHMKDYAERRHVPKTKESGLALSTQLPSDFVHKATESPKGVGHHSWETGQSEIATKKHLKSGGSGLNYMNLPKMVKGAHERYRKEHAGLKKPPKDIFFKTKRGKNLKESKVDTRIMKGDVKDLVDIQGKKEPWEKVPYHKMSDIRVKGIDYPEDKKFKNAIKRRKNNLM